MEYHHFLCNKEKRLRLLLPGSSSARSMREFQVQIRCYGFKFAGQGSAEVALDLVQFLLFYPNMTPAEIKAIMQRSMQPFKSNKARRSVGELDIMRML